MKQHQHDRTNFSTQENELILYSQKDDIIIISMGCRENSDKEDFFLFTYGDCRKLLYLLVTKHSFHGFYSVFTISICYQQNEIKN